MSDDYLFAYHIMFLYNCHLRDSFEFWFLLWSLNAVDLEVRPPRARRGQERGKEWKQNERGLPREWSTIHSRTGHGVGPG